MDAMKVTAAVALKHNCEMIEKLARHMGRLVKQRLENGDTNQVAWACEKLCGSAGNLIEFMSRCDAERWNWFIMVECTDVCRDRWKYGGKTPSELLRIATGKNRQEWLRYADDTCRHPLRPY